ncbi:ADP-ribosylglycohydrolase [Novosphingobium sediminis]|uniref:ADP-ribosylglycohydrolase n=1 Tax=Novosphingobium sediminis TaxID=707214 RepID=A0A512AR77_9SPHN|nr:ADP-ribosylglycohydrolase family protein [Novosphingobium sediminis]GEO02220.1 ADP-ribosylglycohydrolase [Novosphingobium sediminis]
MSQDRTDLAAIEDRALGALLGLAVGDALGTTLEFTRRDSYPHLTDMIGGGPFELEPGQWTDDTSMALALAESLLAKPDLDEIDLMGRFANWYVHGVNSCTGSCFDIGNATRTAIDTWLRTGRALAGSTDPNTAGNGSLMRLSPVAIRHWPDPATLVDVAKRQSLTTHGAPQAVEACARFALVLADAIAGRDWREALDCQETSDDLAIAAIIKGNWRSKGRLDIASSGYVIHSLEAAFWCVDQTETFRDAVLIAANLGDDADTTAAITGQLAGVVHGAGAIPQTWLDKLAWREDIESLASRLFAASLEGR